MINDTSPITIRMHAAECAAKIIASEQHEKAGSGQSFVANRMIEYARRIEQYITQGR